jgi:hypothetical protein
MLTCWCITQAVNFKRLYENVQTIFNTRNFGNATKCGISGGKRGTGTGFSRSTGISGLEA